MGEAHKDPHNRKLKEQFDRYLMMRKPAKHARGSTVNVREEVLDEELVNAGSLILAEQPNRCCHFHRVMAEKELYETMTVKELRTP